MAGTYAMNKQIERARQAQASAADNEPDMDDQGGPADNDQDDQLIPPDHELDELTVKPADNGYTVNHRTKLTKRGQQKRAKAMAKNSSKGSLDTMPPDDYGYPGRTKVFETKAGAAGHTMKILSAHEKARSKG